MANKPTHKWDFKPGMRAGAYSWKSSAKAIERLKSANSEIRAVAKVDPVTAAEGVIALAQRIWPAFEHIDTSSGALGTAVRRTLEELLPILIEAPADGVRVVAVTTGIGMTTGLGLGESVISDLFSSTRGAP